MERDIDGEMNQLLEDIPIGLILDDEETETGLLGAETEPPTEERGGATQAVAPQRCIIPVEKGGGSKGKTVGTLARGCPC